MIDFCTCLFSLSFHFESTIPNFVDWFSSWNKSYHKLQVLLKYVDLFRHVSWGPLTIEFWGKLQYFGSNTATTLFTVKQCTILPIKTDSSHTKMSMAISVLLTFILYYARVTLFLASFFISSHVEVNVFLGLFNNHCHGPALSEITSSLLVYLSPLIFYISTNIWI